MTIEQDIQAPAAPAYIELFEIDCTMIPQIGQVYLFTNNPTAVNFGGDSYTPFPVAINGIEQASDGAPARPTLEVSNINKLIGTLAFSYGDIIGAGVIYIRTFEPYLNTAQRISAPPLRYFIGKKNMHNEIGLAFELRSPLDKERAYLPKRQMLKRDFPGLGINKRII